MDFSRIFIFGPPDFSADFLAGFFLLIFVGKSAQKNPPGKSPAKSSKIYTTKIPDTFLQRGRANLGFGLSQTLVKGNNYNSNGHLMQHLYSANVVALLSGEVENVL